MSAEDFMADFAKSIESSTGSTTPTTPSTSNTQPPVVTPKPTTSSPATTVTPPKPVVTPPKTTTPVVTTTKTPETPTATTTTTSTPKPVSNTAGSTTPVLNSAPECKLPAIDIIQTEEQDTKTVVRWKEVAGAAGYDVMKRTKSGDFVFIERVKSPIYTAYLARGAVKYEDFKIAAVCGDMQTASINTSKVTSVKTGPVQTLLMILFSLGVGALIVFRKRLAR